jgi:hypothetical protein
LLVKYPYIKLRIIAGDLFREKETIMKRNRVPLAKIRIGIVSLSALAILASAFFVTPLSALADASGETPAQQCFDIHMDMAAHAQSYEEAMMHEREAFACIGYQS